MRVAVLDDYQGVALAMGPWDELGDAVTITAFTDHLAGDDALIQRLARGATLVRVGHLDEREAAGPAGGLVADQADGVHLAEVGEELLNLLLVRVERQIAYVNSHGVHIPVGRLEAAGLMTSEACNRN